MPSLSQLTASQVVKLLLIGDSGTGKTGSIASLVKDGYHVRVLDMDNGWESLEAGVRRTCPDRLDDVQVETLRDIYKSSSAGPVLDGSPKAFVKALGFLDKWPDGSRPKDWGMDHVLVVDSLTFLSDAAYAWADFLNPSAKDKRQIYGAAQEAIEHVLALLTGATFNTNVIVTSHVRYMDLPDGSKKGFPTAVGQALGPTIPRYFNSMAACTTEAITGKRRIQTSTTPMLDLKNPRSFDMEKSLPIETGLATFFNILRGPCPTQTATHLATPEPQPSDTPTSISPRASIPSPSSPAPMPILTGLSLKPVKMPAKA